MLVNLGSSLSARRVDRSGGQAYRQKDVNRSNVITLVKRFPVTGLS